jgi:hypothetical protein
MKLAGLRLAAAVAETLPHNDRNTAVVQAEAWKLLEKHIKVSQSKSKKALVCGRAAATPR